MPSCGAINYTYVNLIFNTCKGRAKTTGHHYSCPYLDKEDMELNNEDNYKVIKKEDTEVSLKEKHLSPIPKELFKKYKALSTNVSITYGSNNLWKVPSQTPLYFRFTTSSPISMRNELLAYLSRLLEGTEKPILTPHSHKLLLNIELAAIVRNAIKNINSQLDIIHYNIQQYCHQHCTDCYHYYCKSHGSSHHVRSRHIRLELTICSICGHKRHGYLSCSWIRTVRQKEKEFQANQRDS